MMNNAQIAQASLNDIVFEGRNKAYGAYVLRRLYQRHVTRALIIATAIFALLVFFPVMASYLKEPVPVAPRKRVVEIVPINPPPLIEPVEPISPPPPVAPPPPPVATVRLTAFKVVPNNQPTDEPPSIDELKGKEVGPKTIEGTDPATVAPPDLAPVAGAATIGNEVVTAKPYIWVEQMPELPGGGGQPAIVAAIQKAVRYPPAAIRNGVEGKVYVNFVVNAQGEVVDIKVVKGLGMGLDEETIRAINSLPEFIPGKQNGREVSVSFTVPITFKIQ